MVAQRDEVVLVWCMHMMVVWFHVVYAHAYVTRGASVACGKGSEWSKCVASGASA
jgi:hypothetical protein